MEPAPLRLINTDEEVASEAPEPKVFTRTISAPPGAPWEQKKAATLEARIGAPLPLRDLEFQVVRMDRWRPGQISKFAAFYVRTKDVGRRFAAEAMFDGHPVEVVFVGRGERALAARKTALLTLAGAGAVVLGATSLTVALSARQGAESQLEDLERQAKQKTALAREAEAERRETRALDQAGMAGRSIYSFLTDIDWASAAKTQTARIDAIHWDRGAVAVEARGDDPPFSDQGGRHITRMDKPLKPHVWVWGVGPGSQAPAPPYAPAAGESHGG